MSNIVNKLKEILVGQTIKDVVFVPGCNFKIILENGESYRYCNEGLGAWIETDSINGYFSSLKDLEKSIDSEFYSKDITVTFQFVDNDLIFWANNKTFKIRIKHLTKTELDFFTHPKALELIQSDSIYFGSGLTTFAFSENNCDCPKEFYGIFDHWK